MFGYLGGVTIAVVAFDLAARAWRQGDPFVSRFELGWWLLGIVFSMLVGWLATLTPFLAVRWSTGRRAFEGPAASLLSGTIVIFLTFPIYLWIARALSFDAPAYATQFVAILSTCWPALITAGAAFGLGYWLIERRFSLERLGAAITSFENAFNAAGPEEIRRLRASWLRRCAIKLSGLGIAVLLIVPFVRVWWPPHEPWWPAKSTTTIPHIRLVRELPIETPVGWLPDGLTLAMFSGPRSLALWNADRDQVRTVELPAGSSWYDSFGANPVFLAGGQQVVIPWGRTAGIAFSVVDVATSNVLHELPGPQPGGPPNANRVTSLAISPDTSILAVAFGRGDPIPVAFFSTKNWTKIRDLDNVHLRFSAALSFAGDGGRFAAASLSDIWIVATDTGALVRHMSPRPSSHFRLAMNRAGTQIAFDEGYDVRVVNIDNTHAITADAADRYVHSIAWDPNGRFLVATGNSPTRFGDAVVRFWSPPGGGLDEKTIALRPSAGGLALAPRGDRIAVGNGGYTSIFAIEK